MTTPQQYEAITRLLTEKEKLKRKVFILYTALVALTLLACVLFWKQAAAGVTDRLARPVLTKVQPLGVVPPCEGERLLSPDMVKFMHNGGHGQEFECEDLD